MSMRGIVIDPGQPPRVCNVPDTSPRWDTLLGGNSQVKYFSLHPAALVYLPRDECNTLPTLCYNGVWYYGTLLVVGWRNGHSSPLSAALAAELAEAFSHSEVASL